MSFAGLSGVLSPTIRIIFLLLLYNNFPWDLNTILFCYSFWLYFLFLFTIKNPWRNIKLAIKYVLVHIFELGCQSQWSNSREVYLRIRYLRWLTAISWGHRLQRKPCLQRKRTSALTRVQVMYEMLMSEPWESGACMCFRIRPTQWHSFEGIGSPQMSSVRTIVPWTTWHVTTSRRVLWWRLRFTSAAVIVNSLT